MWVRHEGVCTGVGIMQMRPPKQLTAFPVLTSQLEMFCLKCWQPLVYK